MKILLQPKDYLWDRAGTHVCDDMGFAVQVDAVTEVEIDEACVGRVIPLLMDDRSARGLSVEFGIPLEYLGQDIPDVPNPSDGD